MKNKPITLAFRRRLVLSLLALATLGITLRAVHLQLFQSEFLRSQGNNRHQRLVEIPAHRGMIMDRNGEPLAVSSPMDSIWADPQLALQHTERLGALDHHLQQPVGTVEQKLRQRQSRRFYYLARRVNPDVAAAVEALNIPGIGLQQEFRRFYPTAEVSSQLLGFTDINDSGQQGLERIFNGWLKGVPGQRRVLRDRYDRIVEEIENISLPQPGKPLYLSIDRRIQYLAYRALKAAYLEHHASAASAVVLDVTTGEVLAMVNQPAANPNDMGQRDGGLLRNRAVTDTFEPGSTFKPLTVAMALESQRYGPGTLINTSPGRLRVGRNLVRDNRNYGVIDISRVIVKSSNVGVSRIALDFPPEQLWSLFRRLGFGQPTGLGLAGESSGYLGDYADWGDFEYVTHTFGYGISVTLMQLAGAYGIIAADGISRPLSLLPVTGPPAPGTRVLSADTARALRYMMEGVVSRQGTARRAAIPGYRVAGKTGTVRKVINGRYSPHQHISLFAGMAPVENPRLVMVVMVDDAKGGQYYGGQVAAPVFSQVMSNALRLLNVPPDEIPSVVIANTAPTL